MSKPTLEDLALALREVHSVEACSEGEQGRRRLERSLQRARGTPFPRWVLAGGITLGATAAWAGISGGFTRWSISGPSPAPSAERGQIARESRSGELRLLQERVAPVADISVVDSGEVAEQAPAAVGVAASRATSAEAISAGAPSHHRAHANAASPLTLDSRRSAVTKSPDDSQAKSGDVDPDDLYRQASEAHFDRKDPQAALLAWDRYLAVAGAAGRMSVEARYNRAITLVRLGRRAQARDALAPFARGEYGSYRQDEAERLLESLDRR